MLTSPTARRRRNAAHLAALGALVGAAAGCDAPTSTTTTTADPLSGFVLPSLPDAERAAIVHKYDRLDPTDQVPRGLLEDAMLYFDVNAALIPKQASLVVVDQSRYSGKDRFWLIDTATGAVEAHKVAHGDGSDPDNDGFATLFGNVDGSHMSSLGFYLTAEIYDGTHVHSMRLDGLSPDGSPNGMANTNVRSRLIVVHEATYVSDGNASQQGRSNGCLALDPTIEVGVVDRIHDGTLIYAAISPLAAPVGRTPASPPGDAGVPTGGDAGDAGDAGDGDAGSAAQGGGNGGCATTDGAGGLLFGFGLGLALASGRRRRPSRTR